MEITVDRLINRLEVFLRENPDWADSIVRFEHSRISCTKNVQYWADPSKQDMVTKTLYLKDENDY